MDIVIVVSYPKDGHATRVIEKLTTAGVLAVLWDISKFPKNSEISYLTDTVSYRTTCRLHVGDRSFIDSEVLGVFWRRPRGIAPDRKPTGLEEYIRLESEVVIRSLVHMLPTANWISSPEPARLAGRKPVQL